MVGTVGLEHALARADVVLLVLHLLDTRESRTSSHWFLLWTPLGSPVTSAGPAGSYTTSRAAGGAGAAVTSGPARAHPNPFPRPLQQRRHPRVLGQRQEGPTSHSSQKVLLKTMASGGSTVRLPAHEPRAPGCAFCPAGPFSRNPASLALPEPSTVTEGNRRGTVGWGGALASTEKRAVLPTRASQGRPAARHQQAGRSAPRTTAHWSLPPSAVLRGPGRDHQKARRA